MRPELPRSPPATDRGMAEPQGVGRCSPGSPAVQSREAPHLLRPGKKFPGADRAGNLLEKVGKSPSMNSRQRA